MQIKTDYEIGQKIWHIYKNEGEVCVYDAHIIEVTIDKDGISYTLDEDYVTVKESDVILYGDMDKLYMKICNLMDQIREEESEVL
jgi:hypothetical protein